MMATFDSAKGNAKRTVTIVLALASAVLGINGCHSPGTRKDSGRAGTAGKAYSIRGKVISVDAKHGVIALDTEAIPGFMEAMTMAYTLDDPSIATELHPGDIVTAQLQLNARGAVLSEIVIVKQAMLDVKPTAQYHVPQAGDVVPDFKFLNQSDRRIDLQQFRGKVLVLTFIYTRCSSSRYCPLMSRNFAALNTLLTAEPRLYARTHLLSISFDPKYDTPPVLRSYGGAYTGRYTKEKFAHWDFAAPSEKELASVLHWFDMGVTSSDNAMQHSLSTAVIDANGVVRYWYPTNTWTPKELLQDVRQVLTSNSKAGAKI